MRLLMVITPTGILLNLVIALQGVPAAGIVVINTLVPDRKTTPTCYFHDLYGIYGGEVFKHGCLWNDDPVVGI